ncbi:MAG TPA: hypothetical protein VK050_06505 [Flavobacteriaceae bacterium]|nr:hypothetical protein [Flavobacteriaceae bacterium]
MNFVANEIFDDNAVNVIHNQILRLEPSLAITGTVGRILKGDVPMEDIYVSALVYTSDLVQQRKGVLGTIGGKVEQEFGDSLHSSMIVDNCLQLIIDGHYIEIWNMPGDSTEIINGMRIQTNIPNNIL